MKMLYLPKITDSMKRINSESDFDFILDIQDCNGVEIGWPGTDWDLTLYTSTSVKGYTVGVTDGVATSCYEDGGKIHVVVDNHGLGVGVLRMKLRIHTPDKRYPDGVQTHVIKSETDIELVRENCDDCGPLTVVATLPLESAVFGGVLAEMNKRLSAILGVKGLVWEKPSGGGSTTTTTAVVAGPRILQRGMPSIYAHEGVIYANRGYIRVPTSAFHLEGDAYVADLSAVDLKSMYVSPGYSHIEYEKKLMISDRKYDNRILVSDSYDYIMRGADGLLRACNLNYKSITPTVEAPKFERCLRIGHGSLMGCILWYLGCTLNQVEIQVKHRRHGKKRWFKLRDTGRCLEKTIAVARVRYKRKGRRPASPWSVIAYKHSSDGLIQIYPLG